MLRPTVRRAFRLAIRRAEWTDAEIDEEIRVHIELRVEQLMVEGWSRRDAEAEARLRFGPSWNDAVLNLHRSGRAREGRIAMRERLESTWQDMRYAARVLRRAPRFTITAVLTLALGLGFTTVIFSLVDHIVLRPMPYTNAGELVVVREVMSGAMSEHPSWPVNASHFLEWRACRVCEGMSAMRRAWYTLSGQGEPQRLGALRVSANLFTLLGARPALGRAFRADEEQVGRDRVVILSDAFWRRQFGADPSVIGRTITLSDTPVEVVGVMPAGFTLPTRDALGPMTGLPSDLELYRPLALTEREATTTGEFDYAVIARLRAGATVEQARAQLDAVAAEFSARATDGTRFSAAVIPMHEQVVGGAGRPLLLLLCAAVALLLIVCVNLTNLSLARATARGHESAVRVALGAGRARLARLALAESLIVAIGGGLLGLLLAYWGLRGVIALAPATLPRVGEVSLDGRVFAVAAFVTALVGVIVGVLPALRSGRTDPGEALKASGRTATGGRVAGRRRAAFIAAQIAFSTVLLVAAGLFLTSLVRVLRVERGFDTEHLLAVDVAIPQSSYPTEQRRAEFYDAAQASLASIAGVKGVASASALPLEGETWINGIGRAEDEERTGANRLTANFRFVSPRYFGVLGTRLLAGRDFDASDRKARVIVLSERTARALWPGQSALGKRVRAGGDGTSEVIGVAADVRTSSLEQEGSMVVYLPLWEYPPTPGTLVVRTAGDPAAMTSTVRAAIRRIDPSIVIPRVRTMQQVVSSTIAERRFQVSLLALFALMALVTASVGIYGVISQALASRVREIGVRMALGARPWDVHRLVLREGLAPVAMGLAIGIVGSLAAGRGIEVLLFEVRHDDPLTILGVCALLGMVAVVACAIPARRTTSIGAASLLRLGE